MDQILLVGTSLKKNREIYILQKIEKKNCEIIKIRKIEKTFGHISYTIKKVKSSQLLIFEKYGLVWPADIWPAHFFQILKVRKI